MNGYYTDLAIESGRVATGGEAPGVRVSRDENQGVTRVRVDVLDERGERETGRRKGTYSTLYSDVLDEGDPARSTLRDMLISELRPYLPPEDAPGGVLVLGLGNRQVTPDALGPRTADMVLGTRALLDSVGLSGLRRVMTAAPGVYGSTGIEAGEAVKGLVRELHPELIIAVDALCARDFTRIASTVQLSDSGIQPGSGVGNHRAELSRDSLGVPVLAIGVPMVVYAATIVRDVCDRFGWGTATQHCAQHGRDVSSERDAHYRTAAHESDSQHSADTPHEAHADERDDARPRQGAYNRVEANAHNSASAQYCADSQRDADAQRDADRLSDALDGLIVTPREIDSLIERSARLLSEAINLALHPSLTEEELRWLTI